jgi:hypothetical protein
LTLAGSHRHAFISLPGCSLLCTCTCRLDVYLLLQHLLPEQCLLDEPEHYSALLKYIPDEELRNSLGAKWAKGEAALHD